MSHRSTNAPGWALVLLVLVTCSRAGATSVRATSPSDSLGERSLEEYRDRPAVQAHLRYFLGPGRRSIERALSRGVPYMAMIQRNLKREGLPSELAWLPLIESGFSSAAMSSAGAAGMWQFMPETARLYGLRVNRDADERRDAFKATRAAVRHLRDLTDRYGSPFLAAAAYNAGATRIDRGLAHLEISDAKDEDFFRLSRNALLSAETRDYVPKLIAAALIAENPWKYGLRVEVRSEEFLDSLVVNGPVRLSSMARDLAVSLRVLHKLNPQFDSDVTPAGRPSLIRYPSHHWRSPQTLRAGRARWEAAAGYDRPRPARSREDRLPASHRLVLVREGDTVASLAASHGLTANELCRENQLPDRYVLRPGRFLRLPTAPDVAAGDAGGGRVPD